VGTSLLGHHRDIAPSQLREALRALPPTDRRCGAEINSIQSLIDTGRVPADVGLQFFHSQTPDGQRVAETLVQYYRWRGHAPVESIEVEDLQDEDPRRFRTRGLRTLTRKLCQAVRDYPACAFNATGGYKAQIAIAVLLGQALEIPVFYLHEKFREIIEFPPLPFALDYELWMRASGMLNDLARTTEPIRADTYEELDEKMEALVERVEIDGVDYLELAAPGQIVRDTFRERFRSDRDQYLPPNCPAERKQEPSIKKNEGHLLAYRNQVIMFMQRVTQEVGPVVSCHSNYFNPDLPARTRFVETREHLEGIFSPGGWTMRFRIETTATTQGQRRAVLYLLNEWYDQHF
jgi:putative CRISPR-associated protein (TIGR02619 family)